jgi:hypothetical protein
MKRIYKFKTFVCAQDHASSKFVEDGVVLVPCDHCGDPAILPSAAIGLSAAMHGDEIDYVDHNLGREPVHIRSKAERRRLMSERGLTEFIRHTPVPGTDKSPHTTDWSKGSIDAYTLEAARVLVSRQGGKASDADEPAPVANAFSYTATPSDVRALVEILK